MADRKEFKVVCRSSMLSRAQAAIFISRLQEVNSNNSYQIIVRDTAGDLNQQQLLQEMDGKDFFTKEIQDFLLAGEADFAVHSLKDVSSDLFFKDSHYAIFSRDDPRDVAIFNSDIKSRIGNGQPIRIGTSSPRRSLMAIQFLSKALPWIDGQQAVVEASPIRGNVDTRLRKLGEGNYDGIILAAAGLNRLLRHSASHDVTSVLLKGKAIMVLPLIECPPAPGQGALVAETKPGHKEATALLDAINDSVLVESTRKERQIASQYGAGCHQQFGIVHLDTQDISFTYGSGVSKDGHAFTIYNPLPQLDSRGKKIFSAGDYMKSLFKYTHHNSTLPQSPAYFIASHHALHSEQLLQAVSHKRIWAAGTRTWTTLAKKGLWVEGCADALGLEFGEASMKSPLIGITRKDITIITDEESAGRWKNDGWQAHGAYRVAIEQRADVLKDVASADIIFWTSFSQFVAFKDKAKAAVIHCCPAGKTAVLIGQAGVTPVVFPGIKGFNEWRKQSNTATTGE